VLYLEEEDRLAVLVDLAGAPGRCIVFTRTKHRAKALTRKLVAAGVAAVELHGNLAQNARERNLSAFTTGSATTLVATDIAARGIHVDDVRIVIHADPPSEHKAYLHRSGRSGRAGASGTVVTLTSDVQRAEVHALTRRAGVRPTATRISPGHPLLAELAPGERRFRPSVTQASGRSGHRTPASTVTVAPRAGRSASGGHLTGHPQGDGGWASIGAAGRRRPRRPRRSGAAN
jgi:superfamily II DNA/RNA helicase